MSYSNSYPALIEKPAKFFPVTATDSIKSSMRFLNWIDEKTPCRKIPAERYINTK